MPIIDQERDPINEHDVTCAEEVIFQQSFNRYLQRRLLQYKQRQLQQKQQQHIMSPPIDIPHQSPQRPHSVTPSGSPSEEQENHYHKMTSKVKAIRPECLRRNQLTTLTIPTITCTCQNNENNNNVDNMVTCSCADRFSPNLNVPQKRKYIDEKKDDGDLSELKVITDNTDEGKSKEKQSEEENMERYKRYQMLKRRFLANLAQRNNMPLFYLYGDLLLIPKYKWGNGNGVDVGTDRRLLNDPRLNTPIGIESDNSLEASSHNHSHSHRTRAPSNLVKVVPNSQSLEEWGFTEEWFSRTIPSVIQHLNKYGICALDRFLGEERADSILAEVKDLYSRGEFTDGQVVSRSVHDQGNRQIRGDKITWVTGNERECETIGRLVSLIDTVIARANHHHDARKLSEYNITLRTRAMVACYPGENTHYVKHVDNPDGDGRCITAIYYLNKNWQRSDGGLLTVFPQDGDHNAEIEPLFDRMLFFWSDRRNPHEVLPAVNTRYAITVWYLDQREREQYLARMSKRMVNS